MSLPSSPSLARGGKVGTEVVQASVDQKMTSMKHLVLNLCDPTLRERSLAELSQMREMFPDLAPLLWYSFGTVAALVQEILRIYPALSPPTLTSAASTQVCNVLALFQCIASLPETRSPFIEADIPLYLYPFLRTVDKAQPFEQLRLATLGVIGALVKDENAEAAEYLLQRETIPLCLNIMEMGNEPSKTVSTFILLKVLLTEVGLEQCCDTRGPFYAIAFALQKRVDSPDERPSARLLKCIIQCYLRLFDHRRGRAVLKTNLPSVIRDGTFNGYLMGDPSAQECLQKLLVAFHGCNDNAIVP
ncbi:CCR4-NOT transcription complex subunit 9-like [Triticum dicoccoides]|uniref:CCR4-NOT transcription complex subunit 9-like n=1 Tax=Triticum dicoccoides TaxID=85692 RepID=UPI000E7C3D06|nr:CCR4-NOT transcription complex subunit 9-like [Triticum dicoccoides]